ncbi:low temperature requirement protein LtrA [Ceratobasidium sp. AG-Ba]|nr:low temperature requirement protein LtrA [Ceratobasidium sp. AG-Ba]
MSKKLAVLFRHIRSDPNPDEHVDLFEHRDTQWRPFFTNPFVPAESSTADETQTVPLPALPALPHRPNSSVSEKEDPEIKGANGGIQNTSNESYDVAVGKQAPEWLNLFYDLAWTASFANITSSYSFNSEWDALTYTVLFALTWWMWASQVFYSIDFYTDDWAHLISILLQLVIFGGLSAVTRDIDISNYITHLPGVSGFEEIQTETLTPKVYMARKMAQPLFERIALIVALSRLLLFVQYAIVIFWATRTSKPKRCPRRLLEVPISLFISTALFFTAYGTTKYRGDEKLWAIGKFVLWALGFLVEIVAHVRRLHYQVSGPIRLKAHGSIRNRFNTITTIIMGEGINAIAGTLYSIQKSPGFTKTMAVSIVCCAVIIFGLVYLYYQGSAPSEKPVRRRAAWALVHWPWLLSVILLLSAVKNQLLLVNFINSAGYITDVNYQIFTTNMTDAEFNHTFGNILLESGSTLDDQLKKYTDLISQNITDSNNTNLSTEAEDEIWSVWYYRMQLESVLNIYTSFMSNDSISDELQNTITRYQYDYDYAYQDVANPLEAGIWEEVVWGLMKPSVQNTRYIMVLCGATLWSLATLNLIQSWPRDRFQWYSIVSRYGTGLCMMLLLFLNFGKYKTYFPPYDAPKSERTGVINWMDARWVLPTLAIIYGVQIIVDAILLYISVRLSRRSRQSMVTRQGDDPNKND